MVNTFRETQWFKLGAQDAQPAVETIDGDEEQPSATVAMLPIEDRYGGDVSAQDTASFGLHTGMTDRMKALDVVALGGEDVPMQSLVREMKRGGKRMMMIGAGVAAACTAFVLYLI